VCGDQGTEALHHLLKDRDARVLSAASRAAGALRNRAYLQSLIPLLANPRARGSVIEALAAYGNRIIGTLGDILEDETAEAAVRRQIPRVLKLIPEQRSADVLLRAMRHNSLPIRMAALKALNRLREANAHLDFAGAFVTEQIWKEARGYFELAAGLAPFAGQTTPAAATRLLARTIEERLRQTLERLFRLLGLRYPPKQIYTVYLAINHRRRSEESAAAVEFLDNVLDRDLKRILLPLFDAPEHLLERGRELFGVRAKDAETAIRDLIAAGDPWLVSCAMASAAELRLRKLAPAIGEAARRSGEEVAQVARSVAAVLA
jgi:AAA family ATP:ADP antiporter